MTPSVRDLDIGEMIALSSEWLGELRATFQSIPEIRELLPQVEADHQALVAARGPLPVAGLERGDLGDLAGALDDRHDHLMRALYLGLEGQAEYLRGQDPPAEDEAEVVERAQASLFPEGLDVIQRSYQSEAGNARQMVAVVEGDAALQRVLGRIHLTQEVSALDVVRQIGAVGARLGEVERRKVEAQAEAERTAVPRSEVRRRMRAWADTAETVLAALRRSRAGAEAVEAIRRPVLEAAEKASARRRARRKKGPEEPQP